MLNDREFKALDNLSMILFEFEELGKIGGGAGKVAIQGLIDKGFMLKGQSTRHPDPERHWIRHHRSREGCAEG